MEGPTQMTTHGDEDGWAGARRNPIEGGVTMWRSFTLIETPGIVFTFFFFFWDLGDFQYRSLSSPPSQLVLRYLFSIRH